LEVVEDVLPVKMPMFGVDHNPVQAESRRHFRKAGGFQSNPEAVGGVAGGQFFAEFLEGGSFHSPPSADIGRVPGAHFVLSGFTEKG
jgi:hypothetical protein